MMCKTLIGAVAVMLATACGGTDAASERPVETRESVVSKPEPSPSASDKPTELAPGPDSRAAEAARQACLAYNEAAQRLRDESIGDDGLEWAFQEVAALAMVAEDPLFEAAADALWQAAQDRDRRAVEQAARVFVGECERLVPTHRLIVP